MHHCEDDAVIWTKNVRALQLFIARSRILHYENDAVAIKIKLKVGQSRTAQHKIFR